MGKPNKNTLTLHILSGLVGLTLLSISNAALYHDKDTRDQASLFEQDPWVRNRPLSFAADVNRLGYRHLSDAVSFLEQQNKAGALDSLEKAKNSFLDALKERQNIVSFNGLAKLALLQKNNADAEKWINKSLNINADNPETLYLKAKLLIMQGHTADAESLLQKIVKNHDTYTLAYITLAEIYSREKQFVSAENYLKQALELDKTMPNTYRNLAILYRLQGQQEQAQNILQKGYQTLQSDFRKSIKLAVLLAKSYVENNQAEKALQLGQSIFNQHSDNVVALNLYLDALIANGKQTQAETLLTQRIEKDKQDINSRKKLILLLSKRDGDQTKITALFKDIIAVEKDNVANYVALVHYLIKVKNYSEAEHYISITGKVFSQSNLADILRAELALAQDNVKGAANLYQKAYKKNRNNNLLVKVVQTLKTSGQQAVAVDLLQREIRQHQSIAAHILLAGLYLKDQRLNDAEKLYRAVLEKNPNHFVALNDLAWLLSQRNQNKKALPLARKALDIVPNNPDVIDTYQTIRKKLGLSDKN